VTITEAQQHVGDGVVYQQPGGRVEQGVITSVGGHWVFVRYGSDTGSKATHAANLTLLATVFSQDSRVKS
jgi:ribosomal protein L35AE/L33A